MTEMSEFEHNHDAAPNGHGQPMGLPHPPPPFRDLLERPHAIKVAREFVDLIEDVTTQLVVAGSLRRRLARVKDVEIVAVPQVESVQLPAEGLFAGDPALPAATEQIDLLHLRMTRLLADGVVEKRMDRNDTPRWGDTLKYLWFDDVAIDLFCPDADRLGWILLLRTGPAAFSQQMVVERGKRTRDGRPGLRPPHIVPQGGWLTERTSAYKIKTPTEEVVFALFDLPYKEPWERT
jgi:DNA polymerase/3'-5' exonuclease PolX